MEHVLIQEIGVSGLLFGTFTGVLRPRRHPISFVLAKGITWAFMGASFWSELFHTLLD